MSADVVFFGKGVSEEEVEKNKVSALERNLRPASASNGSRTASSAPSAEYPPGTAIMASKTGPIKR